MQKVKMFLVVIGLISSFSLAAQVRISKDTLPPHPSAILHLQDTTGGLIIPRLTKAQRNAIIDPAMGLIVYQTNGEKGFYYYESPFWKRLGVHTGHYIGEPHEGGFIFYLTGEGDHGLIVSAVDVDSNQVWSNVDTTEIGESAQSHWDGNGNSTATVNQQGHMTSAAQSCLDYVNASYGTGIYDDWHAPSIGEVIHLINNSMQVQKNLELDGDSATKPLSDGRYWSSCEASDTSAWTYDAVLTGGGTICPPPRTTSLRVSYCLFVRSGLFNYLR